MTVKNNLLFGFGCMRLPVLDKADPSTFDFKAIETLFDGFLDLGFTYFDTAYTYHSYQCEKAVAKALVARHSRDSFELATKLPLRDFKDRDDLERVFAEQLNHCGVDYFDYYLLHNMGHNVYAKCVKYDAFHFVKRKKEEGKIRNVGMSFHDTPELLDKILADYADCLDFIQLQINYVDMDSPNVQGAACLAIAAKYGKPVCVMEPCKGGTLIHLPEKAIALLKKELPGQTPASLALRFAASQKGVFKVLSGMNTPQQLEENCSFFNDFKPLSEKELAIIDEIKSIINENTAIPCTACEYCTHGCPKNIAIPKYFAAYNSIMRTTGNFSSQQVYYNNTALAGFGKAGECIACGQCEEACPQHLPIRKYLEDVAERFESGKSSIFPTRKA